MSSLTASTKEIVRFYNMLSDIDTMTLELRIIVEEYDDLLRYKFEQNKNIIELARHYLYFDPIPHESNTLTYQDSLELTRKMLNIIYQAEDFIDEIEEKIGWFKKIINFYKKELGLGKNTHETIRELDMMLYKLEKQNQEKDRG